MKTQLSFAGTTCPKTLAGRLRTVGATMLLLLALPAIHVSADGLMPTNCVPPPFGLVSWWRAEGDGSDSAGANNGVLQGGVTFVAGEVGQAFSFDGTSNTVQVPASASLDVGQGNGMTIEAWINPAKTTTDPIADWSPNGAYGVIFWANQGSPGTLYADLVDTGGAHHLIQSAGGLIVTNVFQHVAVTYDKASGVARLFVNGVAVQQASLGSFTPQTSYALNIGYILPGAPFGPVDYQGQIDELSLYSRALATNEIQSIYAAGAAGKCITPPPPACVPPPFGLVSWWRAEGDGSDSAGANNGVLQGGVTFVAGEVGQAFSFDGTSNTVQVPASASLDVGQGNGMTIEAWINPAKTTTDPIADWSPNGAYGVIFWANQGSPGTLYADLVDTGGAHHLIQSAGGLIVTNVFQHVAVTYDKASGVARLFVNGVAVQQASLGSFTPQTSYALNIGYILPGAPFGPVDYQGQIDELSLYSRALATNEIQSIYAAGAAGKCAVPAAPFIISQPVNQTVMVGGTATFTVGAGGTPPLNYQWSFNGTNVIAAATNSSLALTNVQSDQAGNYAVQVSNAYGSTNSANAALAVRFPPALVQVKSATVPAGGIVTVPVVLVANGNENALSFSLNFSTSRLAFAEVTLGSSASGASVFFNTNSISSGKLGLALALPAGTTFASGTQEVFDVSFTAAIVTNATATSITFGGSPIGQQLADVSGNPLSATYARGTVTITAVDFEGDVYPRPNGNKAVTISDWVQVGRFVARLDYPTNAGEFQRADCAPRVTLGDGRITVADWVQAGRYAAGLDPLTPAGGPTSPISPASMPFKASDAGAASARQVSVTNLMLFQGQPGVISVTLETQGNENALGFSLAFDPVALGFTGATLGGTTTGATLNVNTNQIGSGQLGLVLALPAGSSFAAGAKELINVGFQASGSASGSYSLSFADQPVPREVSDAAAETLTAGYAGATIVVNPLPPLSIALSDQNAILTWPVSATNFVLQVWDGDLSTPATWMGVEVKPDVTNDQNMVTLPIGNGTKLYRLSNP